jgi:hypothetical protein
MPERIICARSWMLRATMRLRRLGVITGGLRRIMGWMGITGSRKDTRARVRARAMGSRRIWIICRRRWMDGSLDRMCMETSRGLELTNALGLAVGVMSAKNVLWKPGWFLFLDNCISILFCGCEAQWFSHRLAPLASCAKPTF